MFVTVQVCQFAYAICYIRVSFPLIQILGVSPFSYCVGFLFIQFWFLLMGSVNFCPGLKYMLCLDLIYMVRAEFLFLWLEFGSSSLVNLFYVLEKLWQNLFIWSIDIWIWVSLGVFHKYWKLEYLFAIRRIESKKKKKTKKKYWNKS